MSRLFAAVRAGQTAAITRTVEDPLGRPAITFARFARDHAEAWRRGGKRRTRRS